MKISNGVKLIIGLGNPGKKYKYTRHNLGMLVVNSLRKKLKFSDFKLKKRLEASISEGKFGKEKIILALPETFMNDSGKAVKSLATRYKLPITNIYVIHDDVDIPLGKIRISKGRGAAGHKGVQSVINELKTKNFVRFRIGIKPAPYTLDAKTLDGFVLKKFTKQEKETIKEVIKKTMDVFELSFKKGLERAMNEFNKPRLT